MKLIRNLLYHATMLDEPASWKIAEWNIEQLCRRWHVFTGRKIVAVAFTKQQNKKRVDAVRSLFPPDAELIFCMNDPVLREVRTFFSLLNLVCSVNPEEQTFYAHTKGVTRVSSNGEMWPAVKLWTEAMYHHNLDRIDEVDAILDSHACAGIFKSYRRFSHFDKQSKWHYSGTFFWFRNDALFSQPNWELQHSLITKYHAECYLSLLFDSKDAGCLFGEDVWNMYSLRYARDILAGKKKVRRARRGLIRNTV